MMRWFCLVSVVTACQRGEYLSQGDAPVSTAPHRIRVVGTMSGSDGVLIATQVTLSVGGTQVAEATPASNGGFVLEAEVAANVTEATVAGTPSAVGQNFYGSQIQLVHLDPGVMVYKQDITLPRLTVTALSTTSTTDVPIATLGQTTHVIFPAAPKPNCFAMTAAIDPGDSPGAMRPANDPGKALQTAGMFYVDAFDASFNRITLAGTRIQVGGMPPDIPDVDALDSWKFNGTDWNSTGAIAAGLTAAAPGMYDVNDFGYWNADRAYRTACVTGTIVTTGGDCPGAAVKAVGPDNIASRDTSGATGSFCVEGAQTRSSTLTVGMQTRNVTMPSNPGSCSAPETCANVGTIMVDASTCGAVDLPCEFRCGDGSCIAANRVCNSIADCPDGGDEAPSICQNPVSCCEATMGCPGETGSNCAATCCCCPNGQRCCANTANGCCASP